MAVTGRIADKAKGELPEVWRALSTSRENTDVYGDGFLQAKVDGALRRLFGPNGLTATEQDNLPEIVADYAGKLVALDLINPGLDFFSKQPTGIGATGRNENKGFADRSARLIDIRKNLIEATRSMWPEVQPLLTTQTADVRGNVPRVREIATAYTADPFLMPPAWDVPVVPTAAPGTLAPGVNPRTV